MLFAWTHQSYIERLPNELLLKIFDHCDARTQALASRVNRRWFQCATTGAQWRHHYGDLTERAPQALPKVSPTATWRALYNTRANVEDHEIQDDALQRAIARANYTARQTPLWNWNARRAGTYFGRGIGDIIKTALSPLWFAGAAASAVAGIAAGTVGPIAGVGIGLAATPLLGPGAGLTLGLVIGGTGLRGCWNLQKLAAGCVYLGTTNTARSLGQVVEDELEVLVQSLSTAIKLGESGYHHIIRAPLARAQATRLTRQRDRIQGELPRLKEALANQQAILDDALLDQPAPILANSADDLVRAPNARP